MIAPLVPATIRGVIWYQGESNTSKPERYATLFPEMIHRWRGDFRQRRLPFLFVQLANYQAAGAPESYARLRESQRLALRVPATGMAVAIDIGEAADIHPRNKQEVGRRLSLWALNRVYGRDVQYSGPLYRCISVRSGRASVRFKHTEGGLVARGGALQGFEIAGEDGTFHPANAQITGDAVQVWSDAVTRPVAVRYAWANNPEGCNLYNQAGLPASPFTTARYPPKIRKEN
jgi:sialate O-acetylesterase